MCLKAAQRILVLTLKALSLPRAQTSYLNNRIVPRTKKDCYRGVTCNDGHKTILSQDLGPDKGKPRRFVRQDTSIARRNFQIFIFFTAVLIKTSCEDQGRDLHRPNQPTHLLLLAKLSISMRQWIQTIARLLRDGLVLLTVIQGEGFAPTAKEGRKPVLPSTQLYQPAQPSIGGSCMSVVWVLPTYL